MIEYGYFDMNERHFMPFLKAYKNRDEITAADYDIFDSQQPVPTNTIMPIKLDLTKLTKFFDFKLILVNVENS